MKTKQYTVKVFEIEIGMEREFLEFIDKNAILLKNHLLLLKGNVTPLIYKRLQELGLEYTRGLQNSSAPVSYEKKLPSPCKVVTNLVRSGQEIVHSGHLLILGRVNDGATIDVKGSCIALNRVDGTIFCQGEMLFLKPSHKTKVIFHNHDITQELELERFQLITIEGKEIEITQYDIKDFLWA